MTLLQIRGLEAQLQRRDARIAALEAELAAIGAGGVNGPLMGASLAANAGSEAVAWVDERVVSWLANSRANSATIGTTLEKGKSPERPMPLYAHPSPPEGMAGWRDIATAPKDKTNVLLLRQPCGSVANGFWLAEAYAGNGAWIWPYVHKNPTHWMPAPPLASEAKDTQ